MQMLMWSQGQQTAVKPLYNLCSLHWIKQKVNMKQTRLLMGMPITVNIVDASVAQEDIDAIFDYFFYIDDIFSTYKDTSEISQINKGVLAKEKYSKDMKEIFAL